MVKRTKYHRPDEPLRHADHRRPVNRREFISQGFRAGTASVLGFSALSMMGEKAHGLAPDLMDYFTMDSCTLGGAAGRKIPFICFDLAGGANISGSNVLVGGAGGQRDSLSTAGYAKLGLPPDIIPSAVNPNSATNDFIDDSLGLLFHSESAMLRGIVEKTTTETRDNTNGAVIPARSDNDTGNNPHNPMYGIYQAGVRGQVLQLIGSSASESGGNSMAPALMIDPEVRPTKIDRPEDASGLVDVGDLRLLLDNENDIVSVLETIKRISDFKLNLINTGITNPSTQDRALKERISCEYLKSADTFQKFPNADSVDPSQDTRIIDRVNDAGIFSVAEFDSDREFRKTASVMKLVIDGLAGAGTISMGGYDYHTGDRRTGEERDLRVGRCIGACMEYARLQNTPVMIYVFSDGSVFSNGMIEMVNGIEKGVWTGDNSSTAASFFLVFDPSGRVELLDEGPTDPLQHQQIGWMRSDASVETSATPAASNVNSLVDTVILNYMALHGKESELSDTLVSHSLGSDVDTWKRYTAFKKAPSVGDNGYLPS
jgi:hypothetical protein